MGDDSGFGISRGLPPGHIRLQRYLADSIASSARDRADSATEIAYARRQYAQSQMPGAINNPYRFPNPADDQRHYPPRAGGGARNRVGRESLKAAQALAAGVIGKGFRSAWGKKKAAASRSAAHAAHRAPKKTTRVDNLASRSIRAGYAPKKRGRHSHSKYEQRYPQLIKQKYWLTSHLNYKPIVAPDGSIGQLQGTVINATGLYSADSLSDDSASVVVLSLNNTEQHWDPNRTNTGQSGPYRTGIQICGAIAPGQPVSLEAKNAFGTAYNDAFIWEQNTTNTDLTSLSCPFFQSGCSETAVDYSVQPTGQPYVISNSVLKSTSLDIDVWNPILQPQTMNIKLIRNNTNVAVRSGNWGKDQTECIQNSKTAVNSQKFTNPQEYSTIWTHTFKMPGLRAGTPLRKYHIKKHFNLDFLRSQYRKVFAANSVSLTKLAMQAESSFAYDPGFFNGCYFVLSSTLDSDTHIAQVQQALTTGGNATGDYVRFPQLRTGAVGSIANTPTGPTGFEPNPKGALFGYSGMVHVDHRVQSIRRHLPLTTFLAISPLEERLKAIEAQLEEDSHAHDVKVGKHNKTRTSSPVEIPEETMSE